MYEHFSISYPLGWDMRA